MIYSMTKSLLIFILSSLRYNLVFIFLKESIARGKIITNQEYIEDRQRIIPIWDKLF
jgi:hypothetical protein